MKAIRSTILFLLVGASGAAAAAQTPEPMPIAPPPLQATLPPAPAPEVGRAAEIAVELAWLGDAATFPYVLKARANAGAIDLLGRLPTAALKEKAAAMARAAGPVPVRDLLIVERNMALLLPTPPTEEFAAEAKTRLFSLGGGANKTLDLKMTRDGKLFLAGVVCSDEERLAHSRVFAGLAGCRLVRNELTVMRAETASSAELLAPPAALPQPADKTSANPDPRLLPKLQRPIKNGERHNKDGTRSVVQRVPGPDSGKAAELIFD